MKLPGLLALGFVAMALAYRWGSTVKSFFASAFMGGWSLAVMALVGWASKLGFGWLFTLGTANVVRSWMSPPTLLALGNRTGRYPTRLGDHTTAVLLTRAIGVLIIAVTVTWFFAVFRGRLHPVGGSPEWRWAPRCYFSVVQPWYLLWAIIPLAAWATRPGFRIAAIAVSLIVGIRTHRQRRPVRHLPDRRRHVGQRPDRDRDRRAYAQHASWRGIPNNESDAANTGSPSEAPTPSAPPGAYAESREVWVPNPVRLRGVSKSYGSTTAVSGLDLDIQSASVLALLGPNGAGKTTTVEMCEGFTARRRHHEVLGMDPGRG